MNPQTWDTMARKFGVRRCRSCDGIDHRAGLSNKRLQTIHWSDRAMTRASIRRFLMLVSQQYLLGYEEMPGWRALYASNEWARTAAIGMHIRLPAKLFDTDKAHVAWLIQNQHNVDAAVRRWSQARSTTE